jgi:hypothetical protein
LYHRNATKHNMKQLIYSLLVCIGLAFLLLSCDGDPIPNKCAGKIATSADFKIESYYPDLGLLTECDTCSYGYLKFSLKYPNIVDSVWWVVGNDSTIFRQKSFTLSFDTDIEKSIKVKAVVLKNKLDLYCVPNDSSKAEFSKKITFIKYDNFPIWGTYTGYNTDNPTDVFNVEVIPYFLDNRLCYSGSSFKTQYLKNLPKGVVDPCATPFINFADNKYFMIKERDVTGEIGDTMITYRDLEGFYANNSITINYQYEAQVGRQSTGVKYFKKLDRVFKGKKIK